MDLNLNSIIATEYSSMSQKIRVMSEEWVSNNIYCPSCGNRVDKYENNRPVADFYCKRCIEDFELKSKQNSMGRKIVDGSYHTMIERLQSNSNPNFFFLNYDKSNLNIINFMVIPKHFFTPDIIEKRKPLSFHAKRAGWIGCNILLDLIPQSGKIFYIKSGKIESKEEVIKKWHKTTFLKYGLQIQTKGWLIDIIRCIEKIGKPTFTLNEIYQFEEYLKHKYPNNRNIRAKIRQQLQILRDKNYLKFIKRGEYSLI